MESERIKEKEHIRIHFTDFWNSFDLEDFFIYKVLSKRYDLVTDEENPDYLIFSCFGNDHLDYPDCVKIYYTGENIFPDFNLCDYALGFADLHLGDRFFRLPEWVSHIKRRLYFKSLPDRAALLNRKFCNFVYSNNSESADPFRLRFFKRLSEYKRVDSGGKVENNIGECVDNKLRFIADYKFTLAFENSSISGYTTEKLIDPMLANSLPVYWGNPYVEVDFNRNAMVYVKDYEAMDSAIAEIIALDNDDAAYLEKLRRPWFPNEEFKNWEEKVAGFLDHILNQDKEAAIRRVQYGWNFYYSNV